MMMEEKLGQLLSGDEVCALKNNQDWPRREERKGIPGTENSTQWLRRPECLRGSLTSGLMEEMELMRLRARKAGTRSVGFSEILRNVDFIREDFFFSLSSYPQTSK